MLHDEEIRVDIGHAAVGDFMRMVHMPTGIQRMHPGPLKGIKQHELKRDWLSEIEAELVSRGMTEHILPDGEIATKRVMKQKR